MYCGRALILALAVLISLSAAHASFSDFLNHYIVSASIGSGCRFVINLSLPEDPPFIRLHTVRGDTGRPTDSLVLINTLDGKRVGICYTDPINIGYLEVKLPPGDYLLLVGWAPGFLSRWVNVNLTLKPNAVVEHNVTIPVLLKPWESGWYMVDMHHHSDYADGKTPPPYVAVAQSAAGLDFITVTDHDYVGNCPRVEHYARLRNKTFICGIEISPPWGHFNAFPILNPENLKLRGTMKDVIEGAREAGASIVIANHPSIEGIGVFRSKENNTIPGGYYEGWDLAEINGGWSWDDQKTLLKMMKLWDAGIRKYLTAGSDVHDIWTTPRSGFPRSVVYVPDGPSDKGLTKAKLTGISFITYGPFIFTDPPPGSILMSDSLDENITIKVKLFAAEGLRGLEVWSLGKLMEVKNLTGYEDEVMHKFLIRDVIDIDKSFGWIVFIAYDINDNKAITTPIWVDPSNSTTVIIETMAVTSERSDFPVSATTIINIIAMIVGFSYLTIWATKSLLSRRSR